ncbi:DUF6555 family protein [Pseudomonas sp. NPDC089743]|uniref:DUF6555 family protein n=1 Tax=Pseudomonas sp. NPDC089743 TaxID=3364471 RepID=UPI003808E9EE
MPNESLYAVAYRLRGEERRFIIRAENMDDANAWHWAACDAGVGVIPRFGSKNIKKVSRPLAERYGITNVQWSKSGVA